MSFDLLRAAVLDELEKIAGDLADRTRERATPARGNGRLRSKAAGGAMHKFLEGVGEEALPVAGALVGSGVGKMLGANQLATSAAGYGLGGLSDIALRKGLRRPGGSHG